MPNLLLAIRTAVDTVKLTNDIKKVMNEEDLKIVVSRNVTCDTIRCTVVGAFGILFDFVYMVMTDPVALMDSWTQAAKSIFSERFHDMARVIGMLGLFVMINLVIYASTRFAKVCQQIKKICTLLLKIPLVNVFGIIIVKFWTLLFDAMDAAKAAGPVVTTTSGDDEARRVGKRPTRVEVGPTVVQSGTPIVIRPESEVERIKKVHESIKNLSEMLAPVLKTMQPKSAELLKCDKCGYYGHTAERCNKKDAKKCDYCGIFGHIQADCRRR